MTTLSNLIELGVRTAIFPVAGLGTRFLPASKVTPKELLPVIDVPLIQYAIDEARDAGIERMIFVINPAKTAIERYVTDDPRLRSDLEAKGKPEIARQLQEAAFCPVEDDVVFAIQQQPLGLGHAVLCAKNFVLPGPVAVILPDDLILGKSCMSEMVKAYATTDVGHLVATMEVERNDTVNYGVLDVMASKGSIIHARGMIEKPTPEYAPSCEAVVGRYILDASILDALETQQPGANGEIQLTDAITRSSEGVGLAGFRFSGTRFDCGSKVGMLRATLYLAAQDPECAPTLNNFCFEQSEKLFEKQ